MKRIVYFLHDLHFCPGAVDIPQSVYCELPLDPEPGSTQATATPLTAGTAAPNAMGSGDADGDGNAGGGPKAMVPLEEALGPAMVASPAAAAAPMAASPTVSPYRPAAATGGCRDATAVTAQLQQGQEGQQSQGQEGEETVLQEEPEDDASKEPEPALWGSPPANFVRKHYDLATPAGAARFWRHLEHLFLQRRTAPVVLLGAGVLALGWPARAVPELLSRLSWSLHKTRSIPTVAWLQLRKRLGDLQGLSFERVSAYRTSMGHSTIVCLR